MSAVDEVLASMLGEDLHAQASRDAGRIYQIERTLRAATSHTERLTLQRERARLIRAVYS